VRVLTVIVVISADSQVSDTNRTEQLLDCTHEKMAIGRATWSNQSDSSWPSVFWYPRPVPRWIVPRSRLGPHDESSGRDRGM
jgi:hypothetical protein